MNKFILNGAGIIDLARLHFVEERAGSLTDGRFAVINGLLFDMLVIELSEQSADLGYSCSVCVYDATDICNASYSEDLKAAYTPDNFIVGFEFYVSPELAAQDNQHCIDAEQRTEALFVHLIEQALKDSNNARTRFNNFTRGLDLDHIEGGVL